MNTNFFENAKFNLGWEIPLNISLFGKSYSIVVVADAYYATEKATIEQNTTYKNFLDNYNDVMENVEKRLIAETGSLQKAIERFIPKMLKIKTNGDAGLVFDDKDNFENGLVVTVDTKYMLLSTDEYF